MKGRNRSDIADNVDQAENRRRKDIGKYPMLALQRCEQKTPIEHLFCKRCQKDSADINQNIIILNHFVNVSIVGVKVFRIDQADQNRYNII